MHHATWGLLSNTWRKTSNICSYKVSSWAAPQIMEAIEALDPERLCTDYWAGKHEREAAAAGLPLPSRAGAGRPAGAPRRRGGKRNRWARKGAACSLHCSWLWSLFETLEQPALDFLRLFLQATGGSERNCEGHAGPAKAGFFCCWANALWTSKGYANVLCAMQEK